MVGEITAFLVLGLLDRTGLFELKPPFLLRHKEEFPDCARLLADKNVGRFPDGAPRRYVNLCRLTGLAWAVWGGVALFFFAAGTSIMYHWVRFQPEDVFKLMGDHPLVRLTALDPSAEITCFGFWCAVAACAVLMTVYYSVLLTSCRDSEANLKTSIQRRRRIATAS
jgi:hypothetical protein